MALKIKVCGMRQAQNIKDLTILKPDFMGFIFYPKSPRYVGEDWDSTIINKIPNSITRVGVFVNEGTASIIKLSNKYNLTAVQLHGNETPQQCQDLMQKGYIVLKAFQVDEKTQCSEILAYQGKCNYLLYDTKSKGLGGSGHKFNWEKLTELNEAGPFFLSGGITKDDADKIKDLNFSNLEGLDLNSKFELEPALKDIKQLKTFFENIRH